MLSPILFNVFLEEALTSSSLLKQFMVRGDLLPFADDRMTKFQSLNEATTILGEIQKIERTMGNKNKYEQM